MKPQTITIGGLKWQLLVTRSMSLWHEWMSNEGHFRYSSDFGIKVPMELLSITVKGVETHVFLHKNNWKHYGDNIAKLLSSTQRMRQLELNYHKTAKQFLVAMNRVVHKTLPANWQEFTFQYTRFCARLFPTSTSGYKGIELLSKKLENQGIPENNVSQLLSTITYPTKHTPLFNSQLDLLKIGSEIQRKKLKAKAVTNLLENWLVRHQHIPVNFCDEPWTIKDAKQQLAIMLERDCREEMANLKSNHVKKVNSARKILRQINNREITHLAHAVQTASYLNEFRKQIFCKVSLGIRPVFVQVAQRAKLHSWRDCFYLFPEEIGTVLSGGQINGQQLLKRRQAVGLRVMPNGEQVFLSRPELNQLLGLVRMVQGQSGNKLQGHEVKGISANGGVVKGTVKILLSSKDFPKFKPNDILVAPYTSVDYIPVMKQAAAFVTNQGGITSHAAIVSREMDKPCVVNTKVATQIFRDGDLVEVDGGRGIIKKITKG